MEEVTEALEEVTLTALGCEVDAERGDGVLGGVPVELCHQQVVVLHAQRELLHIWGGGTRGDCHHGHPPPHTPPVSLGTTRMGGGSAGDNE